MRVEKKWIVITSLVVLLPMLAGLILWDRLPAEMATHFDLSGSADTTVGKPMAVIGLPLIMLGLHLLCIFVVRNDPKRQNISEKLFMLIMWIVPVVSIVSAAAIYFNALGLSSDMLFISRLVMGLLFLILGNYLPKCRHNYTVGIRLPWTLADEDNWNRTHRMAGWLWAAGGLLLLLDAFLRLLPVWGFFAMLFLLVLIPVVYSFVLYRKKERRDHD